MTVFPTNIQTFTTHTTGDVINPDFDNEQQDTLTGLQVKVGVDNSSDINSIDYQLSGVASGDKAVSKTGTETLTNKTLTAPIVTGATITTSTVNGVTLTTGGSATDFLAANGTYQTGAVSNASTTVKGIVELATAAEISAGTATGGTGAALVVSADTVTFSEFGNGQDGALTYDGTTTILGMSPSSSIYTLTRDIYGTTIIVNVGVTIETAGYRIFAKISLTNSGIIKRTPNNGGNGAGITGGTAGAALASGSIYGGLAGQAGANGSNHGAGAAFAGINGVNGTAQTTSIGVVGVAGGNGGNAGGGGSTGGNAGALTLSTQNIYNTTFATTMWDFGAAAIIKSSSGSGSGGSGGGSASAANTGAGGGSGSTGGIVWIAARVLTNSGTISANGGNGGNGGNATGSDGGGGGGGGGAGGVVVLMYKSITLGTVTVTGGTGGSGGTGGASGTSGASGTTGTIIQIAC